MSLLSRTLLTNINSKRIFLYNYFCNEIRLSYTQYHTLNNVNKFQLNVLKCYKPMQRNVAVLSKLKLAYMNFFLTLKDLYDNGICYLPSFGLKYKLRGFLWYKSLDEVNINEFFSLFQMPDTFFSRYKVIELHVWMILCVLPQNGGKNRHVRWSLIVAMWEDHGKRAKMLQEINISFKKNMQEIHNKFKDSLLLYDIGYLEDDISLANAVWYSFFSKNNVDPRYIEALVRFIRHQMHHLNSLDIENMEMKEAKGIWLPVRPHVDEVFNKV